jgi:hypothetical protein
VVVDHHQADLPPSRRRIHLSRSLQHPGSFLAPLLLNLAKSS